MIGTFNGQEIIRSFVTDATDVDYLCDLIYAHWAELDSGAIDYQEYRNEILRTIPERLYDPVDLFFREWPGCAKPLPQTLAFVRELKERGIPVYLLSNAPTYFADYMKDHEILKPFDGILFSAPIHMAKPDQEIYKYFFRKFPDPFLPCEKRSVRKLGLVNPFSYNLQSKVGALERRYRPGNSPALFQFPDKCKRLWQWLCTARPFTEEKIHGIIKPFGNRTQNFISILPDNRSPAPPRPVCT